MLKYLKKTPQMECTTLKTIQLDLKFLDRLDGIVLHSLIGQLIQALIERKHTVSSA